MTTHLGFSDQYARASWARTSAKFFPSPLSARGPAVFGPIESPPWNLQRRFPSSTTAIRHGRPWRGRAPHPGQYFRCSGIEWLLCMAALAHDLGGRDLVISPNPRRLVIYAKQIMDCWVG